VRLTLISVVLLLLSLYACAQAQPPPAIKLADEMHLTFREQRAIKIDIPAAPPGYRVLVSFSGRQEYASLAGSMFILTVYFNGKLLDASRLANKDNEFTMGGGMIGHWFSGADWRLLYSPDFTSGDGPGDSYQSIVTGKAYEFMLDVTDLVKPGTNLLQLHHAWQSKWPDVVLKDLQIVYRQPQELYSKPGLAPEAPVGPLPFIQPRAAKPLGLRAEVAPAGGIVLTCAGQTYRLDSSFTYPNAGRNRLLATGDQPEGHPTWTVSEARGTHAVARCQFYEVRRELRPQAECLDVADTITNLTGQDLGLIIQHTSSLAEGQAREFRVGGMHPTISACRTGSPANPSTFVALTKGGLALLARDDVFRVHALTYYDKTQIGLEEHYFTLAAGQSYTLRWSVFPVPSGDYYDFINAARRTLGVNFAVDGPFGFSHYVLFMDKLTAADARQWTETRSLKYVSNNIPAYPGRPGLYLHGSALLLPEARPLVQKLHDINETLKQARPGLRSMSYFHAYISSEPGAADKYPDSVAYDANGKQHNYSNPDYPEFVPTPTNSYGRALAGVLDLLLDDIKYDGIYWDEMPFSSGTFAYNFPQWDGHTGEINGQAFTLTRKMSSVALLSQPFQEMMVKRITTGGRPLVGNFPPATETMMKYHFPRFCETGAITSLYESHLFTPLGLGDSMVERTPPDIAGQIRRHLDFGCLYYFYHFLPRMDYPMLTQYMFPTTPIELHEGYILGKERILTNRPGIYGWGDHCGHEVHVFDETGRETKFAARTFDKEDATWTELRLPTHYVAAIVRH
jgi:hypothetical protein